MRKGEKTFHTINSEEILGQGTFGIKKFRIEHGTQKNFPQRPDSQKEFVDATFNQLMSVGLAWHSCRHAFVLILIWCIACSAFLTHEALASIAATTVDNIRVYAEGGEMEGRNWVLDSDKGDRKKISDIQKAGNKQSR